ncbi:FAD dependent oxidoreductase [Caballeronia glathei]|uniref:FAD-dependent oxidoreductase n=1 Tax=Caballeronia glathei TaxID=60547 RepID=A0A069PB31_9BURK|nr:FAD-binding oxidoreductase [Caballeronia glathei]KDR37873.1 FAD-dependent oxidoreductase [Caballeronia glathei]CDY75995.1 FAD dependent oxidoreductase [Caballeronia glathei]
MDAEQHNYYHATLNDSGEEPPLSGRVDAKVCVVGGGFAGVNTALGLAERGVNGVVLLESHYIGRGASGRNGGFVFGGFSLGEETLLAELGPEKARALYAGTVSSVNLIRERISRYGIECGVQDTGVILANWFRDEAAMLRRQRTLKTYFSTDWTYLTRDEMRARVHSERYHSGLFEPNALHFHPLNYIRGLAREARARGVRMHESSPVTALVRDGAGWIVSTAQGSVRAEHVVLSCGGYLSGLRREIDASILPIATYILVTEPLSERLGRFFGTRAAVYDTRFAFDYYRPLADTRILWGGRISVLDRSPAQVRTLLTRDLLKVFPALAGVRVDYAWSGLMSYARHQMPQIGQSDTNLWFAQGFGGHGVAPTTLAGETIARAIAQGDEGWKAFGRFGLAPAYKPAGLLAAQLSYSRAQLRDRCSEFIESIF